MPEIRRADSPLGNQSQEAVVFGNAPKRSLTRTDLQDLLSDEKSCII
jgi:hypothetical protein